MTETPGTSRSWSDGLKSIALAATTAATFFSHSAPAITPGVTGTTSGAAPMPPQTEFTKNKQQPSAVDEKLATLKSPPSADESIVGAYRAPDGKVSIKNISGDPNQNHDYASVGKMVSIGYMDDRLKDGTIDLKDKLLPQYAKEFNLSPDITYGDAIKATYYYSNNDAAQAMFKSALHEKDNLHGSVHVSNRDVAEELTGYMKENGFSQSFQSNAAGYPEFSDDASKAYSAEGVPSRSTGYRPGELAGFMVNKYCDGTGHTISPEMSDLLDLKTKQAPFSVPVVNKGVSTTEITSRGIQETARTDYDDPEITSKYAKAGNSNLAKSGVYTFNYNDHSCRVILGGGQVNDRNNRIPEAFNDFVAETEQPKPTTPKGPPPRVPGRP